MSNFVQTPLGADQREKREEERDTAREPGHTEGTAREGGRRASVGDGLGLGLGWEHDTQRLLLRLKFPAVATKILPHTPSLRLNESAVYPAFLTGSLHNFA